MYKNINKLRGLANLWINSSRNTLTEENQKNKRNRFLRELKSVYLQLKKSDFGEIDERGSL